MIILSQFADLTGVADAWRFNMPVGSIRAEQTEPALVSQMQATQPMEFRKEVRTPGFKLVLDRIVRLGGWFGTPASGPPQSSARLRRVIPQPRGPIQSERAVTRMAAGLVPTRPGYEQFLDAGPDSYLS
jgi:hypothetical protein